MIQNSDEVFIGRDLAHTRPYGEDIASLIDEEVKRIVDECYAKAKKLISENMDVLHRSSELLLEKEKIQEKNLKACLKISHMARVYNQVLTEILQLKRS